MQKRIIPGVLFCLCIFALIAHSSIPVPTEGVFIAHHPTKLQYSRGSDWCEKYHNEFALTDWTLQQNRIDLDGTRDLVSVWYVIAAFTDSTAWSAVEFGFGDYDTKIYQFIDWGACAEGPVMELSSSGWPGPLAGTVFASLGDNCWRGNYLPVYYFAGYAYNEGVIPLGPDPQTNFGGIVVSSLPVYKRQIRAYGAIGLFQEGISVKPERTLTDLNKYNQTEMQKRLNGGCGDSTYQLPDYIPKPPAPVYSGDPDLSRARSYELISGPHELRSDGRSALGWRIISDACSYEEFAQTCMQAALDMFAEYGADYTSITLVPNIEPRGIFYGSASYASDGLGTKCLRTGVSQSFRYFWHVRASDRPITAQELSIFTAWHQLMPRHPSKQMLSSLSYDRIGLTQAVADSLMLDIAEIKLPRLPQLIYLQDGSNNPCK